MRGIAPVIASILLLMITLALAGTAWLFFSGYMSTMVSSNFQIVGSPICLYEDGRIEVTVSNVGTATLTSEDFVQVTVASGGQALTITGKGLINDSIQPGQAGVFEINVSKNLLEAGKTYTVTLATASASYTQSVTC
ncbi:MAG: hypothetical protein DRP12_01840 [Candidatus Aenigmatarchaeota archaeon]|nr:MAG: hypothetical protein DRP12_01840 [Candidatus Aenigmarchaeota archaeon]